MTPKFGPKLKELRLEKRITLREMARRTEIDVGYLSKVERSRLPPPHNYDILSKLVFALGLLGEQAEEFTDLAHIENRTFPKDLPPEPLSKILPAFFFFARRWNKEELEHFVQKLREA